MSKPVFQELQQSKTTTRPAVARTRLRKLEGAAAATLLTSSPAVSLPVCALGAIPALCTYLVGRQNLAEQGSSMTMEEANDVLLRRGLPQVELASVLSSLTAAGLLSHAEGRVCIPLFDAELDEHLAKFANRSAGRVKNVTPASKPAPRAAVAPAAAPVQEAGAPVQPALLSQLDDTEPKAGVSKMVVHKPKKQQLHAGRNNRFGATDGVAPEESDPTVARILCERGGYAEITQSYIDHLELAYRGLDVIDAVRRAALWCDGNRAKRKTMTGIRRFVTNWLNNQSRDADVRAAVVRANSQRNGFGQGGAYGAPAGVADDAGHVDSKAESGAELDFDDLTSDLEQSVVASKAAAHVEPAPAATRVSPVARARARVQVTGAGQTPAFRQPASPQLRLSEQLR